MRDRFRFLIALSLSIGASGLLIAGGSAAPAAYSHGAAASALAQTGAAQAGAAQVPAAATGGFEPYTETIPDTQVAFDMVAVKGGTFTMGSPDSEPGRAPDEGPQVQVTVGNFWMGAREVTWDEYDLFAFARRRRPAPGETPSPADAVSKPTPPYADESWDFGKGKQPALGMTWHAAAEYCRWLSAKTGKTYRLATEAEWEYGARAGTKTPWSSGASEASLDEVAWYAKNAEGKPRVGAGKKPNARGLYDLHGNVAEWTLDQYDPKRYASLKGPKPLIDPVLLPSEKRYPHVVRGGSFEDEPAALRSAARRASKPEWSRRDPQQPQSIWWHTDAIFVGFRLVRAVEEPAALKGFKSKITRESGDM